MSDVYDPQLRLTALSWRNVRMFLASPARRVLHGVGAVLQDCRRMLRNLGAEPSLITVVLRVLGFPLIVNLLVTEYDSEQKANHDEVLEVTGQHSKELQQLWKETADWLLEHVIITAKVAAICGSRFLKEKKRRSLMRDPYSHVSVNVAVFVGTLGKNKAVLC
ncbi:hypothetical protein MHYP_G00220630 [Metynnis hypsauchen]